MVLQSPIEIRLTVKKHDGEKNAESTAQYEYWFQTITRKFEIKRGKFLIFKRN